jgi:hypothetical protein
MQEARKTTNLIAISIPCMLYPYDVTLSQMLDEQQQFRADPRWTRLIAPTYPPGFVSQARRKSAWRSNLQPLGMVKIIASEPKQERIFHHRKLRSAR